MQALGVDFEFWLDEADELNFTIKGEQKVDATLVIRLTTYLYDEGFLGDLNESDKDNN